MSKFHLILFFLLSSLSISAQNIIDKFGAVVRSDSTKHNIYLCFTGHDSQDGFKHVLSVLDKQNVKASFWLTGDFVRNNKHLVKEIAIKGHFIGAHSNKHLLYCDWDKRDSLLHSEKVIEEDISTNLDALQELNIYPKYFMPPYEWYNQKVVQIAAELNQTTVNFSAGTRSNADYTTPQMPNYISSSDIIESIYNYEALNNMNGFHLLIHPGTSPERKDKLYLHLDELIAYLKKQGYNFTRF